VLSNFGQNTDRQVVGVWHISTDELHAALAQISKERDIATEAIELSDDERGAGHLGAMKCLPEFWPIVAFAALYLHEFRDELPSAAVKVVSHCAALRFKSKAASSLAISRDPQITDEFSGCHCTNAIGCKTASRPSGYLTTLHCYVNALSR